MRTTLADQALTPQEHPRITLPQPAPDKPRRKPGQVVVASDTGENTSQIVQSWEQWLTDGPHVTMTPTLRGMTLRCVKGLLSEGYTAREVKWALAFWVAEWVTQTSGTVPHLTTKRLEEIVLTARTASDPQAVAWRDAMKAQVQQITGGRARTRAALASIATTPSQENR